jgi:hypothetical protein
MFNVFAHCVFGQSTANAAALVGDAGGVETGAAVEIGMGSGGGEKA